MPPIPSNASIEGVKELITKNDFVIFSLSQCPFCKKVKEFFKSKSIDVMSVEIDQTPNNSEFRNSLFRLTSQRTFPSVFGFSNHLGGCDDVIQLEKQGLFDLAMKTYKNRFILNKSSEKFDYDAVVIGGGSGGLACAKEFAKLEKKVAIFDYVTPSLMGTSWGLGGTCVNVGCIPKKLMHQSALFADDFENSKYFGWTHENKPTHNWFEMLEDVNNYIRKLNFTYRSSLSSMNVKYINSLAYIKSQHEITFKNKKEEEEIITSKYIIVATGERPTSLDIPGYQYCINSDDLFWLKYPPGKTLIIGASYVALECAGFLHGIGYDVTVLVRSIFLRGYDQQMADMVGQILVKKGIKIIRPVIPIEIEKLEEINIEQNKPGKLCVKYQNTENENISTEEFNTVMVAIGRDSCTKNIGLENVKIPLDKRNRVISVDNREQTICENIFAIGDILAGKPQLTPVAIKAGQLLARRLCGESFENVSYSLVPTTVFTPIEYGAIGYSEEDAIAKFGDDIDVYHGECSPLETKLNHEIDSSWYYAKLVCRISQNNKVIGFHVLAPNAGEITQGYAVALQMGATLNDFTRTFGIHPTVSEIFTSLISKKRDNPQVTSSGGC